MSWRNVEPKAGPHETHLPQLLGATHTSRGLLVVRAHLRCLGSKVD